ncbi:hypothetical protein [Kitasatospora sp. NPDC088779]|uniref:DUF6924 domain-containing protein n=1 Tax=unclassified Kitasatospora TaxID=2633591 RepID=UPI0034423654
MTELPCGSDALVVRTDFSSGAAWEALRRTLSPPGENGFLASVQLVDSRQFAGAAAEEVLALLPVGYRHPLLVLADTVALASEEQPLLVVNLRADRGHRIRVVARQLWSIENNLSISNMDFAEFTQAADDDGVFRGF